MSFEIPNITFTKETVALRKECHAGLQSLNKLAEEEASLMSDDVGDVDKVAGQIAANRAKVDLVLSRTRRAQARLFDGIVVDVRAEYARSETALADALAAWRESRDGWRKQLHADHARKYKALNLAGNASLEPDRVKNLHAKLDDVRQRHGAIGRLIVEIDAEFRSTHLGATPASDGSPKARGRDDLIAAAHDLLHVDELAGSFKRTIQGGSLVSGFVPMPAA